jgi:hypothetical protein
VLAEDLFLLARCFSVVQWRDKQMYAKVKAPKGRITQEWRDKAFAPLSRYLESHYPDSSEKIIVGLVFLGNTEEKFYYRHSVNKASIIFDQSGELVSLDEDALKYDYEELFPAPVKRKPIADRFIHPNAVDWADRQLKSKQAKKYREEMLIFLQEYWGPVVNFDFGDLKVGYPIKGGRFSKLSLYVYPADFEKLVVFEVVGDEIAEGSCSRKEHSDYLWGHNRLTLDGWGHIHFIRETLESESNRFGEFVSKVIEMADFRDPVYVLNHAAIKDLDL